MISLRLILLFLGVSSLLLLAVHAQEEDFEGGEGGGGGGGGGGGRRGGGSRERRGGRNARFKEENEIQRPPRNNKRKGVRVKVTPATLQQAVSEALQEQLEPLNTALRLVRLDAFTENINRQLGTLEHIQSKLLTEYGELRAAVDQVTRNTLDLGRQVSALDARVASIDRTLSSNARRGGDGLGSDRERADSEDYPQTGVTSSDLSDVSQAVREAVASINTRLQASERRVKEDLATLENRTTAALRKSHADLDRRIAIAGLDTVLILNTLDKLANNSCPSSSSPERRSTPYPPSALPSAHHGIRGDTPSRPRPHAHRNHPDPASAPGDDGEQDELAYFSAEGEVQGSSGVGSGERVRTWLIRESGRPVTEVQTLNLGMVNRLASEIARQMAEDTSQPRDCAAIKAAGETTSGVYTIFPASCTARFSVQVWCELDEDSDLAWTVVQRRGSTTADMPHPVVDFFRDWAEYKWGFGNLEGEYWLGNEYIHQLTQSGDYELRVDLLDWANDSRHAIYKHFAVGNEDHNYTLSLGDYEGTAGNSLKYHQGAPFSTRDRDNDFNPRGHCARTFHGAWWFTACHESHLNGRYHHGRHKSYGDGINWMAFRGHNYSLKYSRMMIRRTNL